MQAVADQTEGIKQRIDAAMAFAELSQEALETKVAMSRSTLNRKRRGEYDFNLGELYEVAKATGVPVWFLQRGWDGWREGFSPEELRQIEASLPEVDPQGD